MCRFSEERKPKAIVVELVASGRTGPGDKGKGRGIPGGVGVEGGVDPLVCRSFRQQTVWIQ